MPPMLLPGVHHGTRRPRHLGCVPPETRRRAVDAPERLRRDDARLAIAARARHDLAVLLSPWRNPALGAKLLPRWRGVEAQLAGRTMSPPSPGATGCGSKPFP